jgi:hypothetical protein
MGASISIWYLGARKFSYLVGGKQGLGRVEQGIRKQQSNGLDNRVDEEINIRKR